MGASWLADPGQTRAVLDRFGLATKHRLGQNFLVSDRVVGRILDLAELGPDDVVLEVGPGIGTLTVGLLSRASAVCSIEADRELAPVLAQTCATDSERFALVMGDALRVGEGEVASALASIGATVPNKLVANLPYQVAATLILRDLEELPSLDRLVVMVQAEVADRIAARPGTKEYGAYTAKLALWAEATGRFEVGPGNFLPPPHVDSAVMRIDRRDSGLPPERIGVVAGIIDDAFAQRRKTIRNSLAARGHDRAALDAAFESCGINPGCRAETLEPADFIALADALGA